MFLTEARERKVERRGSEKKKDGLFGKLERGIHSEEGKSEKEGKKERDGGQKRQRRGERRRERARVGERGESGERTGKRETVEMLLTLLEHI